MSLNNHANLSIADLAKLEQTLPANQSMSAMVDWALQQQPPLLIEAAVALDEFSHDVVLSWRDGLRLVYSTT